MGYLPHDKRSGIKYDLNRMTDDELAAIWLYISTLPAVETEG
jgi:hypothetical protein